MFACQAYTIALWLALLCRHPSTPTEPNGRARVRKQEIVVFGVEFATRRKSFEKEKSQMGSSSMNCLVAVCTPLMTMKARFSFRLRIVCCDFRWWSFSFRLPLLLQFQTGWRSNEKKNKRKINATNAKIMNTYKFTVLPVLFFFILSSKTTIIFRRCYFQMIMKCIFFFRRIFCFIRTFETLAHTICFLPSYSYSLTRRGNNIFRVARSSSFDLQVTRVVLY